jgi:hypothetical protein
MTNDIMEDVSGQSSGGNGRMRKKAHEFIMMFNDRSFTLDYFLSGSFDDLIRCVDIVGSVSVQVFDEAIAEEASVSLSTGVDQTEGIDLRFERSISLVREPITCSCRFELNRSYHARIDGLLVVYKPIRI